MANTIRDTFGGVADDFNDGDTNGWTATGGTWNVSNGVVDGFGNGSPPENFYNVTYNGFSGADLIYECKVKPVTSGGSRGKAIIFRYQDDNNYYMVDLEAWSQNYAEIGKRVGGTWTRLAYTPFTFTSGQWYLFKAIMKGNDIEFYIDGTLMCKATDTSITSAGKIGLLIDYPDEHVYFDDVVVTPIGADKGDAQAPSVPGFNPADDGSSSHTPSVWQSGTSNDNTIDFGWTEPVSNGDDYFYYETAVDSEGNESNKLTGSNLNFENGNMSNWGEWTAYGNTKTASMSTSIVYEGSYSVKLENDTGTDYLALNGGVVLTPGRTYMFGGWVYIVTPAESYNDIYICHRSATQAGSYEMSSVNTSLTNQWQKVVGFTTVPATINGEAYTYTEIAFRIHSGSITNSIVYVDKPFVYEVKSVNVVTPIAGFWWAVNNSSPENGGTWVSRATLSTTTPTVGDGTGNYIYVKAEDGAGNISSVKTYGPFYIDTTLPDITDPQGGDDTWRNASGTTYNVSFSDATSYLANIQY
ncbi:MAG: carbohydrate binding domain-containing protein, partial [Candidatus Desantisbacteria bacterium]